jgi:hypothetical protein
LRSEPSALLGTNMITGLAKPSCSSLKATLSALNALKVALRAFAGRRGRRWSWC